MAGRRACQYPRMAQILLNLRFLVLVLIMDLYKPPQLHSIFMVALHTYSNLVSLLHKKTKHRKYFSHDYIETLVMSDIWQYDILTNNWTWTVGLVDDLQYSSEPNVHYSFYLY